MEDLMIAILPQMPVVAIILALVWYWRKDNLSQIEGLNARIDRLEQRLFNNKD